MLYFGAIPLTPKFYSIDIVFARNRWIFVSIVPSSHELYSSDFLLPSNAGTLKRCRVSGFGRLVMNISIVNHSARGKLCLTSPISVIALAVRF